jgi:hypothetical protein
MAHRYKYAIKENNVLITASETDEQARMKYFAHLYSAQTEEEQGKVES